MVAAEESPPGSPQRIEWPTVAVIAFVHASWLVLTWYHADIPLPLWLAWAIWISAWWGSVQHEIIHRHPTASDGLNRLLGMPPLWLWLPFERYRQTHLVHHRDERLTDPVDDPESRYFTPDQWMRLGPVGRAIAWTQATLLGRIVFGPALVIPGFILGDFRAIAAGDRRIAAVWAIHLAWLAPVLVWIFGVCGVPIWQYTLAFVDLGLGVAMIRSFAEHRAAGPVGHRTAVVEDSPIFGLLFLNNNLHVAHHRWPRAAWYRLPALHAAHRAEIVAGNGNLVYHGYGDLFRRFALCPHDAPLHRLGRIPIRNGVHSGTA
ncbi:MAG: fatty acid desaturase [Proteobacteria bacterium]|nr:fatty acid desaturase [Pseudomonadota bacterium]